MSLQIDLFKDFSIKGNLASTFGRVASRKITIEDSLEDYKYIQPKDIYTKAHIQKVLEVQSKPRVYNKAFDKAYDSHIEIEKLGICRYCKEYTAILSMEDSLDYILFCLSGCDYNKIYNSIENYKQLSRGIIGLNLDFFGDATVKKLIGIDSKLDKYLADVFEKAGNNYDFLLKLFSDIAHIANSIIEYSAYYLNRYYSTNLGNDFILRSKSIGQAVASTDLELDETIILTGNYKIRLRSYPRMGYLKHIAESVRIG